DNRIRTALYTVASFLPQQVVQQFSKVGNFYFLCVSALQQIPGVSPTGQWTTLFPLAAFVAVAMAREAWEDYKRHVSDSAENGLVCERRRRRRTTWKRDAAGNNAASAAAAAKGTAATTGTTKGNAVGIAPSAVGKGIEAGAGGDDDWETVGDVVRLHSDDFVPADLLLLDSSHSLGWCYIEASNLDGESDLKLKQPLPQCVEAMRQPNAVSSFSAEIYAESPNNNIYEFEGTLDLQSGSKRGKYSLSVAQLLPRGTTVACTETVVGAVVYTGEETKIRKNATTVVARKTSTVERLTNRVILTIMAVVVVMACVSTVFNYLGSASGWGRRPNPWYLGREKYNPARVFCAFVILYNNMIPISLYVALEIVRVFLSLFVDSDLRMFHAATGARAVARNNNIHEDLGRVRHFFTDKTGTLTENSMVFKKMSIAGQTYTTGGEGPGGDGGGGGVGGGVGGAWDSGPLPGVGVASDDGPEPVYCEVLKRELQHSGPDALAPQRRLLLAMALCHTVSVEDPRAAAASSKSSHASATGTLQRTRPAVQDDAVTQYQAASPDELALVRGARELGYVLRRRTMVAVGVTVPGDPGGGGGEMAFQCLCTLPFSSQRRRMSVIYRYPDGRYVLLCKGADAVILERLKAARSPEDETILDSTREHLSEFAIEGLRTLLYAWRVLEPSYFLDWMERYNKASVGETRAEALDALATEIERDLELLGATAIEDRLQQGVPETIEKLRRAGMKLWMLTGDKRETAMNIAYTCQLAHLDSDMIMLQEQHQLCVLDREEAAQQQQAERKQRRSSLKPKSAVPNRQSVLEKLVYLGMLCDGVICSRFSPSQKALIITTMRGLTDGSSATSDAEIPISNVTLAIGDGANDIPMLQAAHVGIGIAGREGLAASRTSDYSIGQFRFVQDLLFVHGRYAYVRISAFTLGTFYKCVVLHIVQFLFQIWTGWSSTSLFEQWTLALYNVTFTSLPIIVVGIFEKDLNRSTLLGAPELYSFGIRGLGFNFPIFGKWMFHAAPTGILSAFTSDGTGPSMASALQVLGTLVFSTVVLTVNLKVSYVGAHNWTLYSHVAFWLSELAWFGFMLVYPRVWPKLPIGDEAAG
ncbi:hypothetical protein DFJ73DRAFT_603672, partial [Zopfochytrium polystomum]